MFEHKPKEIIMDINSILDLIPDNPKTVKKSKAPEKKNPFVPNTIAGSVEFKQEVVPEEPAIESPTENIIELTSRVVPKPEPPKEITSDSSTTISLRGNDIPWI